ncbi:neuropeptide F receptor-like [Tachypleus tridentatus]|uniref:neuropeptide F receptor-like n=1 Tax=Tachypleus tridentatus TaxID=6853 RepID=UPI003FD15025
MPFTLLELMYKNWFLGQFMCKLVPFIQATSVFVSAVTVSAIAIDRKRTIVTLLPHKMNIDHKLTRYTIGIWFISLLLSLPISFTKKVTAVGLPGYIMYYKCIEKWPSVNSRITYMLVTSLAQFLIPMTILLVTHLRIKSHLTCSENKNFKMQKVLWRNRRITMMLMNVSIVYTISWLPWNGFNIIADFNPHIMTTQNLYLGFAVCHLIAMTSSTTNPIFYGWLNTNIQREWIHIIRKIHRNLWTHSADITSTKQMDLKSEPS